MKKNILTTERGSALLISLVVILLISAAALMAVNKSSTDMIMSYNQVHEEQAFYVAEAGLKHAIAKLDEDNSWKAGFDNVAFGQGHYRVAVVDSTAVAGISDTILIYSRGEVSTCVSILEAAAVPDYKYPFSYAMFAKDGIVFDKETCTDSWDSDSGSYAQTQLDSLGNIGSNGTIYGAKLVDFGGDISVATEGGITLGPGSTVNGDTTTTADSVDLDLIPPEEYVWAENNSNAPSGLSGSNYNYNGGTHTLTMGAGASLELQGGVYYFSSIQMGQESNITIAPGASVVVYMGGDIVFNQNSTINDGGLPSDLMIFSQGSLTFNQGNTFSGTFYGPNAHIQYDQTSQVYGSLVGGTIKLDAGACFHYDRALAKVKRRCEAGVDQVTWREIDDPLAVAASL